MITIIKRAFVLFITITTSSAIHAIVRDTHTMIDGLRYMTDYFDYYYPLFDPLYDNADPRECHDSEADIATIYCTQTERICERLQAVSVDNDFLFYDGSTLPVFNYGASLIRSNYPGIRYVPDDYEVIDTLAMRHPYYTGDVWIQDSVALRTPYNLRKTKYHIVARFNKYEDNNKSRTFNEELRSIRTPKYAVVYSGVFKDCTGLHTARIGAAQAVESGAFEGCTGLETVFFESAPYVQDDAFKNCPNIKYVVMNTKCPKAPEGSAHEELDQKPDRSPFDDTIYEKATLYVREDQMEAFRNDLTWGKFLNIRNIDEYLAGVEPIITETGVVEYRIYDLSGTLVRTSTSPTDWRSELPGGIYIVRSSLGTVRKVRI